jgi:hypothetical protein
MTADRDGLNWPHHPKSPSTTQADASIGGLRISHRRPTALECASSWNSVTRLLIRPAS